MHILCIFGLNINWFYSNYNYEYYVIWTLYLNCNKIETNVTKVNSFISAYQSSSCSNSHCRRSRVGRAHLRAVFLTHCTTSSPARSSPVSSQTPLAKVTSLSNLAASVLQITPKSRTLEIIKPNKDFAYVTRKVKILGIAKRQWWLRNVSSDYWEQSEIVHFVVIKVSEHGLL